MKAEEFLTRIEPAAKRSRLDPYYQDIKKLRDNDASLKQICEFLKMNNVTISITGLAKFIKAKEARPPAVDRRRPVPTTMPVAPILGENQTPVLHNTNTQKPTAAEVEEILNREIDITKIPRREESEGANKKQITNDELKNITRGQVNLSDYEEE